MNVEKEIEILKKNYIRDNARLRLLEKWFETVDSVWYRRVWWFLQGYKISVLGTWYNASWNKSGQQYNGINRGN